MNDHMQDTVARALDTYAAALDQLEPTQQLDARIHAAIQHELSSRGARRPATLLRAGPHVWAVAASVALVASIGAVLWIRSSAPGAAAPQTAAAASRPATSRQDRAQGRRDVMVFPSGAVSLWPTEGTVFRVRSQAGAPSAEQQYWLDVRMGNDGSMRIERVLSADGSELFARPGLDR